MVAVCTAWTPPMRLHRHVAQCTGLHRGLCPPLRGVACSTERYYALLAGADSLRRGDLDGRGNLSEQVLVSSADDVFFPRLWPEAQADAMNRKTAHSNQAAVQVVACSPSSDNRASVANCHPERAGPESVAVSPSLTVALAFPVSDIYFSGAVCAAAPKTTSC